MPNYLARVAAAGMRTSIAAKPPVAGPPLSLKHIQPSFTALTTTEQGEAQLIQRDIKEEQVVPALPITTVTLNKPVPPGGRESTSLQDQVPLTIDTTPVIRAPRIPRPVNTAHPELPQLHEEQTAHPGKSTSSVFSTSATMSLSTTPSPFAHNKGPVTAGGSLPRVAVESKEPTGKGQVTTQRSLPPAPVESGDRLPKASVHEVKLVNQAVQSTPLPLTDKVRYEREHSMPAVQAAPKQMATPPRPPAQVNVPPMPATNPTSRQVKLTIGQVDVRVHNRLPAPPSRQVPSMSRFAVTDTLEQHYLDRFRLKL